MKLNFWYLAALLPLALVLSKSAFGPHFAAIGFTLGISLGTLSLRNLVLLTRREPTPACSTLRSRPSSWPTA